MTHNLDDDGEPLIDARHAWGPSFNLGDGTTYVTNNIDAAAKQPQFADDLHAIDSANKVAAYELFDKRDRDRKWHLLAQSRWGTTFLEIDFISKGGDYCADLLCNIGLDRAEHLLNTLPHDAQDEITRCMARRLAKDHNAPTRIEEWADNHPARAVQLLGHVARLPALEGQRGGARFAIGLLPGGPSFLLTLPPELGARFLRRLLPEPEDLQAGPTPDPAGPADVNALLEPLVRADLRRTADLVARLAPWQAAAYVSQLRLEPAARLLACYLAQAPPASRDELCQALHRPRLTVLLRYINSANPDLLGKNFLVPRLSGWPWIDAMLALLVFLGPGVRRVVGTEEVTVSVRREAEDLGRVWTVAQQAVKDLAFYRRQRNHLAALAGVLAVIVVLVWLVP
jgi:hypothetical protein